MGALEIVLLLAGGILAVFSFVMPAAKEDMPREAKKLAQDEIKILVGQEMNNIRQHVDDVVGESIEYAVEKTERSLERLTNEKIMAVNEYSDTVLAEIRKNHEEVMFLYDMLNDKHTGLKNMMAEINKTVQAAEEVKRETETAVDSFQKLKTETEQEIRVGQKRLAQAAVALKTALDKAITEKAAIEKASVEAAIAEKAAMEKAAIEAAIAEKVAIEKAAVEEAIAEKAAMGKAAIEAVVAEKTVIEKAVIEKAGIEKAGIENTPIERIPEPETFVPEQLLPEFPVSESSVSEVLLPESAMLQAFVPEIVVPDQAVTEIIVSEPAESFVPEEVGEPVADLYFMSEEEENPVNHNERILKLYRQGKSKVAIAKELGLGVGEVNLVIDLYKNQ